VIVVAHPDDEILGLGTLLPQFRNLRAIVHVTDGAPRQGSDIARAGASSWRQYADLRRHEFEAAMQRAGVRTEFLCLGCPDQETAAHLPWISYRLRKILERIRPAVVFTHPYEGGHPDHDSCAVAVKLACLLYSNPAPECLEFASYHAASEGGGIETERFLASSRKVWERRLSSEQQRFKRDLMDCYPSQREVLSLFSLRDEPLRRSPKYDFLKPPHSGKLFYENFNWGMTGRRWRQLARRAMTALELSDSI
jgi:LmbE family N-acetylglucosaminyl deacetylase